jgi:hypothetical protein
VDRHVHGSLFGAERKNSATAAGTAPTTAAGTIKFFATARLAGEAAVGWIGWVGDSRPLI